MEGCGQQKWTVGSNDRSKGSSNNADAIILPRDDGHCFGKNIWQFLKRLNKVTLLSSDPVVALLGTPLREGKRMFE